MTPARTTYRTILRPDWDRKRDKVIFSLDYITVPRLALIGRHPIQSLMSADDVAKLAVFANNLERRERTRKADIRRPALKG